jgi:endonuclease-3
MGFAMRADAEVTDVHALAPFSFRWPEETEQFEGGWEYHVTIASGHHRVRHGLGAREVYGRRRVHTVTWLDGELQVEGVEADDYPTSRALLSLLRHDARKLVRDFDGVPGGYEDFNLVDHRREIDAKWSRHCVAVKIREDDLLAWAIHAWLRVGQRQAKAPAVRFRPMAPPTLALPPPDPDAAAVAAALLAHGRSLAASLGGGTVRFTPNDAANALIHSDPFAFLIAVICDQGIVAERAWAVPYELQQRLGHLDPTRMAAAPQAVIAAFAAPPSLHRFFNQVAGWVVEAAKIVATRYEGDASRLWNDGPSAAQLRARLDALAGIGQKKAAMAVEILERDLHVLVLDLSGTEIAYDIHVRRVFLRTGLAQHDNVAEMVAVAKALHPERPGELDNPAWDIGRRWCHAKDPDCPHCPLGGVCPRLIERGNAVKGL